MATITGTTGNDTLGGTSSADTMYGLAGNDILTASGGNDLVYGGAGDDSLYGGNGSDTLSGDAGADLNNGGASTDYVSYASSNAAVTVDFSTGTGAGGDAAGDTYILIEGAFGSDYNDLLIGGTGLETLYGGLGDDTLRGGGGADYLDGGAGANTVDYSTSGSAVTIDLAAGTGAGGDAAGDTLLGFAAVVGSSFADSLLGTTGNDSLYGGAGNDTIDGRAGDDLIFGGTGNDYLIGNPGNDTIAGGAGADTIDGGAGMDYADYSASGAAVSADLSTGIGSGGDAQGDRYYGVDGFYGSNFDDTLIGFNNAAYGGTDPYTNVIYGGLGNDSIDGKAENDFLYGGADNDTVQGGTGSDLVDGGAGNDLLYGDYTTDTLAGADTIFGGDGQDTAYGGIGNDSIDGGAGNDLIFGGVGNDTLAGGDGNDTLSGGAGADLMTGGLGSDLFTGLTAGDTVVGSESTSDNDVLDLFGSGYTWHNTNIIYSDPSHENGIVELLDANGVVVGTISFSNIETVIPCFTPGTLIDTLAGPLPVEDLAPGDLVLTRDNGYQPIRWVGRRELTLADTIARPDLCPVRIAQGALGAAGPDRAMAVSPQHRILLAGAGAELLTGEGEVLAAAHHLTGLPGIRRAGPGPVSYIHILFDSHEIVRSDGLWTESFQPAAASLNGLEEPQRAEVLALFPELGAGAAPFAPARLTLKAHEARALLHA